MKMATYNETWETSLQNILSETETNIANLKRNMAPKFQSTPYVPRQMAHRINEGTSRVYPTRATGFAPMSKPLLEYQKPSPEFNERTSAVIVSVSQRVEQLEQLTSVLQGSVTTLKYENKVQSEEIKRLKDEIKHLTKRLHEKGIDLATEQKLKKWQREIKADVATIKGLMNTRSKADEYHGLSDITTISLSKDISDSKRLLLEETDLLRRECDSMSTRILKLENEFAVLTGESKDLRMRHMRLEKDMMSVNENYRSHSRVFSKVERENTTLTNAIEDLRHEIENIQYDLKKLASFKEKHVMTPYSKVDPSSKKSSKVKDFSHFHRAEKDLEPVFEKRDKKYSKESQTNSLNNSFDVSLLSSEFDEFSFNTSLNLSDEIDPLKSY